jgi:hypothetical protein
MENSNEDVYYADIANLREVLAVRVTADDSGSVEECENDVDIGDKNILGNEVCDSDENTNILLQ